MFFLREGIDLKQKLSGTRISCKLPPSRKNKSRTEYNIYSSMINLDRDMSKVCLDLVFLRERERGLSMQLNSTTVDGLKNRRSFLQGGSDEGLPGPQAGKLPGSFARQGKLSPAVCQIQLPENVRIHVWMRCNALHFPRLESPYLNLHRICVFVLCSTYTALCKILFFPPSQEQHISVFFQ